MTIWDKQNMSVILKCPKKMNGENRTSSESHQVYLNGRVARRKTKSNGRIYSKGICHIIYCSYICVSTQGEPTEFQYHPGALPMYDHPGAL